MVLILPTRDDLSPLLTEAPSPLASAGVSIGRDDYRLVVESLTFDLYGDESFVWDLSTWIDTASLPPVAPGPGAWTELQWVDITESVRGMEWTRGSDEVYGRPRVGEITLDLADPDGVLSPWSARTAVPFEPGQIIRASLITETGVTRGGGTVYWFPLWTGLIQAWEPLTVGANIGDRFTRVTLAETFRDLAAVDLPAGPTVPAEPALNRFADTLLPPDQWRYGYVLEAQNLQADPLGFTIQPTNLAGNRITEMYLTADSCGVEARSLRDGRAGIVRSRSIGEFSEPNYVVWPLGWFSWIEQGTPTIDMPEIVLGPSYVDAGGVGGDYRVEVPYRPDSFRTLQQDTEIVNVATLGRVGGSPITVTEIQSVRRYGERTLQRTDLICSSDSVVEDLASEIARERGLSALRLDSLTIDTWAQPTKGFGALVTLEPGDRTVVRPLTGNGRLDGYCGAVKHRVIPRTTAGILWETEIRVDTVEIVGVLGAQIPSEQEQS